MRSNNRSNKVRSVSTVASLARRLDRCGGSEDYVVVIRALTATRDPAAIGVLASLLDSRGPIALASIKGLIAFGDAAIPAMRACTESLDYDMIRHGHWVLAQLGDDASAAWLRADDRDRIDAYLESKGFEALAWDDRVANESDQESGVA